MNRKSFALIGAVFCVGFAADALAQGAPPPPAPGGPPPPPAPGGPPPPPNYGPPPPNYGPPPPPGPGAPPPPQPAVDQSLLGGPGESCRARADCQANLRCVEGACVDEREGMTCGSTAECGGQLKCVSNTCVNPLTGGAAGGGAGGGDGEGFQLKGAHPFLGIEGVVGPSLPLDYNSGNTADVSASFAFSLKGGVYLDSTELGVEFSPMTSFWYTESDFGPSLQLAGYFAQHIPLSENFYYPIRIGLGMVAVNTPADTVWFQTRLDFLGLTYRYENLMLNFSLPSFRHATDFDLGSVFVWQPGVSANYAF